MSTEKKSPKQRFEEKYVVAENGCWIWTAATDSSGYGVFSYEQHLWRAHRVSLVIYKGLDIRPPSESYDGSTDINGCHICDVRLCVNPDHIFLGTQSDNIQDCLAKDRFVVGSRQNEDNGHCRITDVQVNEIRSMYKTGDYTQKELAAMFSIGQTHVSRIVRNEQRNYT